MTPYRDMRVEEIRSRWKWLVGLGAVMAILGVVILLNAVNATFITTVLVGVLLIGAGLVELVGAFGRGQGAGSRVLHVVLGVLYVVVGLAIVADPLRGVIALTIVVAAMLLIDGVIRLIESLAYRPPHWGLVAVVGVINILLGLWLWTGIPYTGVAIGLFVGLEVLLAGISWITLGWMAREATEPAATEA